MADDDRATAIEELRRFRDAIQSLMDRVEAKEYVTPEGKAQLQRDYATLKSSLKAAAKRTAENEAEEYFVLPAVRAASSGRSPPTNSHPFNANWYGALYDMCIDITHLLHQLENP